MQMCCLNKNKFIGKLKEYQNNPADLFFPKGTSEIVVEVDDDGVISLNFQCSELTPDSKFIWSKNYEEMSDSDRMTMDTKGNKYVCE